jgi:hypothetical protein
MKVKLYLPCHHVTEFLPVFLLAPEIGQHVPQVAVEVKRPFLIIVLSVDFPESFLKKRKGQSFARMMIVLP